MNRETADTESMSLAGERVREELKRRVSAIVVYVLCPLSLGVLVGAAYSWPRTLRMTIEFFQLGERAFAAASGSSLFDKLLWMDLSTMSVLIVLLLSLHLFLGTARLLVQRLRAKTWQEFKSRVYRNRLLPQGLGPVAIRLGLIGTLISFVLIAMMLFGGARLPELGESVAAAETQPVLSAEVGRKSFVVFLFLCASLYSSLVGCAVGYFAVPVLEWVGAYAAGRAMISQRDAEVAEQQYALRLEQASRELGLLARQAGSVQAASSGLTECAEAIRQTRVSLVEVCRNMNETAQVAREVLDVRQVIRRAAGDLFQVCRTAESASELYQKQADEAKLTASGLQEAASETAHQFTHAVTELKAATESMRRDATAAAEDLAGTLAGLLDGLQQGIGSITRTQAAQEELARQTAGSVAACAGPVAEASQRITAIALELERLTKSGAGAEQSMKQAAQAVGPAVGGVHAALGELRGSLEDLHPRRAPSDPKAVSVRRMGSGGDDGPKPAAGVAVGERFPSPSGKQRRSFWRRLFGGGDGQSERR